MHDCFCFGIVASTAFVPGPKRRVICSSRTHASRHRLQWWRDQAKEVESACKPGSVRLATRQSFLSARRRRLAPATYPGTTRAALSFPYLVLLRVGFTVPYGVGPVRGALLPHPFTLTCALAGHRRSALCCTGRQLTLPRSYLALCPAEPGLSSMHLRATRPSGRLHDQCTGWESGIGNGEQVRAAAPSRSPIPHSRYPTRGTGVCGGHH